ncbi:hypothetical protein [Crocosphaera chwakensis]|uniref:Photosystem I assembly protein Ycf4 n=1 Tax=Crocosphaera chwakensis CCY0110 TaxID=391612 RepID=A3IV79_9CHRO|nr:hypothetical protein [Crocosphaera chwakensis]EAZ89640.1 photosystem I assembly protein Ycf4 [Crocosphaera chwakensis CCY0110]
MLSNTAIEKFIVKLRLQAVIEGIDENAALRYASVRLRLATGEISEYEYSSLIDDIDHIFGSALTSKDTQPSMLNHWIEKQIYELQTI